MELIWIDDFIALDELQSFTLAADRRCMTQPAFSRRIQAMEDWFGCPIFDRDTRPISLTRSGIECKKRIYRLRDDIMDMKRISNLAASHMSDNVHVICTTNTIAVGLLPQWLKDNHIDNYRLVVSSVSHAIEMVRKGQCTHAIIPKFEFWDDPIFDKGEVVCKDRLVFAQNTKTVCDIKGNEITGDVLMYSPKTAMGQAIEQLMYDNNLKISEQPVCESASAEAILAQVRAGNGGGWVVESLLQDHKKDEMIDRNFPEIAFDIYAIKV